MTQPSPSERLGPGVLCRGDLRVLFPGVYSHKRASLSPSGFGLILNLVPDLIYPQSSSLLLLVL